MNAASLAMLGSLLLAATAAGAAEAPTDQRTGYAYAADSQTLIYTEHHRETRDGSRMLSDLVTYRDAVGKVIAEKQVDFSGDDIAPGFALNNLLSGHQEGAQHAGDQLKVHFRESALAKTKTAMFQAPKGAIIDAGFDRFVETHWDALMGGETFVRPFLVPSRLEFINFRIRRISAGEQPGTARFEMAVDSVLLRLLVPAIVVDYDAQKRTLLRYVGISNMRDAGGENLMVKIVFDNDAKGAPSAPAVRLGAAAAD